MCISVHVLGKSNIREEAWQQVCLTKIVKIFFDIDKKKLLHLSLLSLQRNKQ